jgi:hypothetical protein
MIVVKYFVPLDNSGEISVVTERALPVKGEKIKIKGNVKKVFAIGTETALVVIEIPEKIKIDIKR